MKTRDMSGNAGTEPATPGSYGEPPSGYRLPKDTRVGRVRLVIADLERSLRFYEETLGLFVLERERTRAALGAHSSDRVLVEILEQKGVDPARRGLLGLYHFAILLPERRSLGAFVRHLANTGTRAGAGDHLVSEAFYLTDPDGLGIEIYADRPPSAWRRIGRELIMATDPVDVDGLVEAAGGALWSGMPSGTVIGHIHLHVGDLREAKAFYSDALGFDRTTWSYPGALFFGAGGYHHHVGTNTWAGASARRPAHEDARLLEWTIELPTAGDVAAVTTNLAGAGYTFDSHEGQTLTCDPWGTALRVCTRPVKPSRTA